MLQTVRVWQGSEDGNYDCRHILKDHTAEVIAFQPTLVLFHNQRLIFSLILGYRFQMLLLF